MIGCTLQFSRTVVAVNRQLPGILPKCALVSVHWHDREGNLAPLGLRGCD
jgi:hypothetical protein